MLDRWVAVAYQAHKGDPLDERSKERVYMAIVVRSGPRLTHSPPVTEAMRVL